MSTEAPLYPIWALVREIRARASMTQVELAEASGVAQSAISNYERARSMPDLVTLYRLAEAAGYELGFTLREPDKQRNSMAHVSFGDAIAANKKALKAAKSVAGVFS